MVHIKKKEIKKKIPTYLPYIFGLGRVTRNKELFHFNDGLVYPHLIGSLATEKYCELYHIHRYHRISTGNYK